MASIAWCRVLALQRVGRSAPVHAVLTLLHTARHLDIERSGERVSSDSAARDVTRQARRTRHCHRIAGAVLHSTTSVACIVGCNVQR
jgi:hypothetical protein